MFESLRKKIYAKEYIKIHFKSCLVNSEERSKFEKFIVEYKEYLSREEVLRIRKKIDICLK